MSTHHFDATVSLKKIRELKSVRRRKLYQRSRLVKLRAELVLLHKEGASYREISLWLCQTQRIKITHTTVMRYLEKLPEIQETK